MQKTLKVVTEAIHVLIQVTNNYTMSYFYSQNDNHVFCCDLFKTTVVVHSN